MRFSKSWLVAAAVLGCLSHSVLSYPAPGKIDAAEELISEDSDADYQYDEVELKPEEAIKRSEVATETSEGSGSEPARKDDVAAVKAVEAAKEEVAKDIELKDNSKIIDNPESDESESPASGEAEDDAPKEDAADVDADTGSGSATDVEKPAAAEETQQEEQVEVGDGDVSTDKASDETAPPSFEAEVGSEGESAKKGNVNTVNEEFEEEHGEKRNHVAQGSKRDYEEQGGCHHCHERGGGCHEGCCCEHERGHHHGHHEHEDCCHHHGHHHGFVHEWGTSCCGGHHEHECCGHHEHGHHHEGDHEHECCHEGGHHDCCHHDDCCPHDDCCHNNGGYGGDHGGGYGSSYGGGGGGYGNGGYGGGEGGRGYGWGRANIPVGYHCHDMVSKNGDAKSKRFCVPVYGFPQYSTRDTIARPVKKQTVHVGYGYASGDNYRLGFQRGGMGGLASTFTGQIEVAPHEADSNHFNKRTYFPRPEKRHFEGHGYGAYSHSMMHDSSSASPYGHPVTHPGFTTMGYPGHALASQDVRGRISQPIYKRDAFEEEPQEEEDGGWLPN